MAYIDKDECIYIYIYMYMCVLSMYMYCICLNLCRNKHTFHDVNITIILHIDII